MGIIVPPERQTTADAWRSPDLSVTEFPEFWDAQDARKVFRCPGLRLKKSCLRVIPYHSTLQTDMYCDTSHHWEIIDSTRSIERPKAIAGTRK